MPLLGGGPYGIWGTFLAAVVVVVIIAFDDDDDDDVCTFVFGGWGPVFVGTLAASSFCLVKISRSRSSSSICSCRILCCSSKGSLLNACSRFVTDGDDVHPPIFFVFCLCLFDVAFV